MESGNSSEMGFCFQQKVRLTNSLSLSLSKGSMVVTVIVRSLWYRFNESENEIAVVILYSKYTPIIEHHK